MKLLIGVAYIATSLLFVATANAKPDSSSLEMTRLEQLDVVTMIDDIAVPIHASIKIQRGDQGYAITGAKAINTGNEATYRLRISRDSNNSLGSKFVLFDKDWKVVRKINAPTQHSLSENDKMQNNENDNQQEATAEEDDREEPASNQASDSSLNLPELVEGVENEGESEPEESPINDDGTADDDIDNEALNEVDEQTTMNESPG